MRKDPAITQTKIWSVRIVLTVSRRKRRMMKCSPTAYVNCPDRTYCGNLNDAVFAEGSECDKFNQNAMKTPNADVVRLPCRIGDKLWSFRKVVKDGKVTRYAREGEVTQMLFTPDMELMLVLKNIGHRRFGVDAFYTREEAEWALKEANNEH